MHRSTLLNSLFCALLALVSLGGANARFLERRNRLDDLSARSFSTNAERLRRGLSPLPPRQLFEPTRTHVARSGPSAVPPQAECLQVVKKDGLQVLGYVDKDLTDNVYVFTEQKSECLQVYVPVNSPFDKFDLEIKDVPGPQNFFSVATLPESGPNNGQDGDLVKAGQSVNSVKDNNSNSGDKHWSQSAIWTYGAFQDLTAHWNRPNDNDKDLHIWFYPDTGKFSVVLNTNQNSGYEVLLVPVSP